MHAENEKPDIEQSTASLLLSHPHAKIIGYLPQQRLYD